MTIAAPLLMLGDCLDRMAEIPAGLVDMVMCDLPYGVTRCAWDSVIPLAPLWEHYRRIVKPNGAIVLTSCQPFTSALVMSNPKMFRYTWVWEKNIASNFMDAGRKPLKIHEDICVFGLKAPAYLPQMEAGRPYTQKRTGRDDTGDCYGAIRQRTDTVNAGARHPRSILRFPREVGRHPTQKPVPLLEYLIRTYSQEGETVLDNAMGSGSTGVACANTGRRFIGIEKDEAYFALAQARIETVLQLEAAD